MKNSYLSRAVAALSTSLLALACSPAMAAPAWITLGDDALQVLNRMTPQTRVLATVQAPVNRPATRGSSAVRIERETVHAVEVDDNWLLMLSVMAHSELQRCGGYMHHDSEADAMAALQRLHAQPTGVGPAPAYTITQGSWVRKLIPQLQSSHLLGTIAGMANFQNRRYNSSHGVNASNWLLTQWQALKPADRKDVLVSQVPHTGFAQQSVSFEIRGNGPRANEVVVLGGHMDSIAGGTVEGSRAPGADDNASGIAGLTEIIRVLMAASYRPERTLRFIGYAAEEVGLRGSQQIAASYDSSSQLVVGVLQLDMTAFKSPLDSDDIWIYTDYTNTAQNGFLANLSATYLPHLRVNYSACGYGCSDHAAWHARGYAASFPHEASNNNYNRAIHTANDTITTFGNQADHALKFTQLGLVYAVEMGGLYRARRTLSVP